MKEIIEENKKKILNEELEENIPSSFDFETENETKAKKLLQLEKEKRKRIYERYKKRKNIFIGITIPIVLIIAAINIALLYSINSHIEEGIANNTNDKIESQEKTPVLYTQTQNGVTFDINKITTDNNSITINYMLKTTEDKIQPLIERSSLISPNKTDMVGMYQHNDMIIENLKKGEQTKGFINFKLNSNGQTPISELPSGYYEFKLPYYDSEGLKEINLDFKK